MVICMNRTNLELLYDEALNGIPLLGTPQQSSQRVQDASPRGKAQQLITLYASLSSASGFILGLPGLYLVPLTLPTDIATSTILQLHLCAAIAVVAGEDPADEATRTRCLRCFSDHAGRADENEQRELVERTGLKLMERGIRELAEHSLRVAGRAATKVPLVGGILGAGSNGYYTDAIGRCARDEFLPLFPDEEIPIFEEEEIQIIVVEG